MNTPDIRDVYKAAVHYVEEKSATFTKKQSMEADEFKRRIRRMENDYNRLIRINTLLCDTLLPKVSFNEKADTINFDGMLVKVGRADPNVPLNVNMVSAGGGYVANESNNVNDFEIEQHKLDMESLLEHYYNSAFRVTKLIQHITKHKKYHCAEITNVRNWLIEHPKGAGHQLYSFGYGTTGPRIKVVSRGGDKKWNDNGLIPNTAVLLEELMAILSA